MKTTELLKHVTYVTTLLVLISCEENNPVTPDPVDPVTEEVTVDAPSISKIASTEVTLSSGYEPADYSITQKGFCYSTSSGPTLSDKVKPCEGNTFSATLTGLKAGTSYYVRAYVMNTGNRTFYSGETIFTTAAASGLEDYNPPTYSDDYRSIADWSKRNEWNLANVHDPTVCLAEDGYYYMYQTDASFGNQHVGHGHFHGRRSKDLVNWELVTRIFDRLDQPGYEDVKAEYQKGNLLGTWTYALYGKRLWLIKWQSPHHHHHRRDHKGRPHYRLFCSTGRSFAPVFRCCHKSEYNKVCP